MTRFILTATILYSLSATVAKAQDYPLRGLLVHDTPQESVELGFSDREGRELTLPATDAELTVVNFWALWCVACRDEMPSLNALDKQYDDDTLDVITISVGPNNPDKVDAFFDELGLDELTKYADDRMQFSRANSVMGLPVTVIVDSEGREIARLTGEADWSSEEALTSVERLLAQ